jgi:hypothetical protein
MQQSTSPATAQINPTKAEAATDTCFNHDDVIFTFPRMATCCALVVLRPNFPDNNLRVLLL